MGSSHVRPFGQKDDFRGVMHRINSIEGFETISLNLSQRPYPKEGRVRSIPYLSMLIEAMCCFNSQRSRWTFVYFQVKLKCMNAASKNPRLNSASEFVPRCKDDFAIR